MSKLEKILGLLGSDHMGERAAAAMLISRMAKERSITIVELMRQEFGPKMAPRSREPSFTPYRHPRERPEPEDIDADEEERQLINQLLRLRSKPLQRQERKFIYDVIMKRKRDADLKPSERKTADIILARYSEE